jgi:ParB/RepB/Spo0J family partition protein
MIHRITNRIDGIEHLPLVQIHTRAQIRTRNGLEEESLKELAASIKAHGLIQPVTVTPREEGGFWIVAGERRMLAASMVGLSELPAVVRMGTTQELAAAQAVENLQREDLHPLDIADGLATLAASYPKQKDLAAALGKSPAWVSRHISLTRLPPELRQLMAENHTRDVDIVNDLNSLRKIKTDDAQHKYLALQRDVMTGLASRELVRAALANALARATEKRKENDTEGAEDTEEGASPTNPTKAAKVPKLDLTMNELALLREILRRVPAKATQESAEARLREKVEMLYASMVTG